MRTNNSSSNEGMQQKFEIVGYLSKASKFNNKVTKCQQEKKAINASQSTNNTSRTSYPSQNLIKPNSGKASDKLNLTNLNPQIIELLLSRKTSQEPSQKIQTAQPKKNLLASSKSSGSLETFNKKQIKKQLSNKLLQRSIIKQKNQQSIENFNPNFLNKITKNIILQEANFTGQNQSQKALKSMITCDESLQKFSQYNRQSEQFFVKDNHQSYQDIQQFNQLINQNIQLIQSQKQKQQQQLLQNQQQKLQQQLQQQQQQIKNQYQQNNQQKQQFQKQQQEKNQIQQKEQQKQQVQKQQVNKQQKQILQNLQQKFQQQKSIPCVQSQSQPQLQLISSPFKNDQQNIKQYDIIQQMKQKSGQYKINYLEDFDKIQININKQMRMILIDWIQQVCMEHGFKRETFYMSIYYIDKYLSITKNIDRCELQLLGVAALQISTKLEEVIPPSMNTIYNFTCGSYTINQINNMEINLIQILEFKLNPVTLNTWNSYYIQIWDKFQAQNSYLIDLQIMKISNDNLFQLIYNLIDFTLLDINSYKLQPQFLSLAAIYIVIGLSLIKRHSFT